MTPQMDELPYIPTIMSEADGFFQHPVDPVNKPNPGESALRRDINWDSFHVRDLEGDPADR